MKISEKDIRRAIYESIKGFRPWDTTPVTSTQPKQVERVYPPKPVSKAPQTPKQAPQQPIDYDKVELVDDPKIPKGAEWAKTEGNFPIKRNGKIYYVSKSATASLAALCFDRKRGVWCILANQRGPGAGGKQGVWNLPVGFVERNESAEAAAIRETLEETGVEIPKGTKIRQLGVRSGYSDRVSFAFSCVLEGDITDYPTSDEYSEPGEVADIKWIPIFTSVGTPLKEVIKKYHWDKEPEEIINRAKTALVPYLKSSDDYDTLVKQLKQEIGYNPSAIFLLDKILSMNNSKIPTTL